MFDLNESSRGDEDMMLEGAFSDLLETTHAVEPRQEAEPLLQLMEELMAGLEAPAASHAPAAGEPEPAPPSSGPAGSSLLSLAGIVEALGDVSKTAAAAPEPEPAPSGPAAEPAPEPEFPEDFDITAANEAEASERVARELVFEPAPAPAGSPKEAAMAGMLEELLGEPAPAGSIASAVVAPEPTELTHLIESMEREVIRGSAPAPVRSKEVPESREAHDSCIVFGLDGTRYAVPMRNVIEIDTVPRVTPVPRTPGFVRGVTNRRGEVFCVLDLRALLGMDLASSQPRQRILVMRTAKDVAAAMIVDEVRGTMAIPLGSLPGPVGPVNDRVAGLLIGVGQHQEQILNVLDVEKLFATSEMRQLTGSE